MTSAGEAERPRSAFGGGDRALFGSSDRGLHAGGVANVRRPQFRRCSGVRQQGRAGLRRARRHAAVASSSGRRPPETSGRPSAPSRHLRSNGISLSSASPTSIAGPPERASRPDAAPSRRRRNRVRAAARLRQRAAAQLLTILITATDVYVWKLLRATWR